MPSKENQLKNKIIYQLLRFKRNSTKILRDITPPFIWELFDKPERNALAPGIVQRKNYKNRIKAENMSSIRASYFVGHPVMEIPAEKLRYYTGISYMHPEHHMNRFYEEGQSALVDFYSKHHPTDMFGRYFLKAPEGTSIPLKCTPWYYHIDPDQYHYVQGELGLDAEHGVQQYGPVSATKIQLEAERLTRVYDSFVKQGFVPDYGLPTGYILQNLQDEWVFVIMGGQHRSCTMIKLGYEAVPVQFMINCKRIVYERDVEHWPMVANGEISKDHALEVFRAFFDENRKLHFSSPQS
jgi:hypothetical protein